jgi:proline iminopeptidase
MSTAIARKPRLIRIRDVSLFVDVIGDGYPLVLMHGGPGLDHHSLFPFRRCADLFTVVFYDHRCNGRSVGAPVSSMTWENLAADADALREHLGFESWAVLGHSFGGNVALEYALRHPERVSHLVLIDSGGDSRWPLQNAAELTLARSRSAKKAELVRRWFNGDFEPREMIPISLRIVNLYFSHPSLWAEVRDVVAGEWKTKMRADTFIFAGRHLLPGWSVMGRLGEIKAPTLVIAGQDDFVYPTESQRELASGIPNARLRIIERAGHNAHSEQPAEVMQAVRDFLPRTRNSRP